MEINRKTSSDTDTNLKALLDVFAQNNFQTVIFFASPTVGGSDHDGPDTNWPLMAALVQTLQGNYDIYDGLFLTAKRYPRYMEVKSLLDAAVAVSNGSVHYAPAPLPFTAGKTEEDALAMMLSVQTKVFDQDSRADYFRLLSRVTEKQLAEMNY
ncbi:MULTISPECIES: hypothetical protein [Pseudomonas]|uniref:Uncharacterized protein n=2 Tax=Pseudomonas TaxID=286 RepID=A0A1L7NNQ2_PSEPU|nr:MULTISPECIES: hypothetical protein [Pseudomonas]HCF2575625.1 hypothetical protein [Pseudomonas aeruginosa]AGN82314.1 hypothetical protein L483_15320 [Pseudomonas putida H8234]KYC19314.1 hypothetical protein WM94_18500 [Pseudomonas sp. ABFPK]MBA1319508.1 hypothetical protein [Pseudomonas monteilii]MBP2086344.1 hypothetical protein [Pseudomonas sp. PvP089]